jgi:hypothetical protein
MNIFSYYSCELRIENGVYTKKTALGFLNGNASIGKNKQPSELIRWIIVLMERASCFI